MSTAIEIEAPQGTDAKNLQRLINSVNKSDPSTEDVAELKALMKDNPQLWKPHGNFHELIEMGILQHAFKSSKLVQMSVRRKMSEMREALGWNSASQLEQMLIEQVCLCWLNHYICEHFAYQYTKGEHNMREGMYWTKRLVLSQKRYLRAVETLGKMQKLLAETQLINQKAAAAKASKAVKAAQLLKTLSN